MSNLLLETDSYKLGHHQQYPPRTTKIYSYFESRVGAEYPYTVFFGLQYLIDKHLAGKVVTKEKIEEAQEIVDLHLGRGHFNIRGWEYIMRVHNGYLPIRIKAVCEGTVVPTGNVMMTVENTDPECYWLTNFIETLLVQVWYPSTVATVSRYVKENLKLHLSATGCTDIDGVLKFMLHDFGCRGATCMEAAAIGGAAHLVNFSGTDTVPALALLRKYYQENMAGFSIPASEHSTMTSWGRDGEIAAYNNMLDKYPTGAVSVVSDSWDLLDAASTIWGGVLRDKVLKRDGRLVVRPDSGDPTKINLELIDILWKKFGGTVNVTGHRVLSDKVRIIQGDGMTPASINGLLEASSEKMWAAENWVFGMGGGLLQRVNRDTQRFAFKCSYATVDGVDRDVFKKPKTDPTKDSKKGRLALIREDDALKTVALSSDVRDELNTVFMNGWRFNGQNLEDIRFRSDM